MKFWLNRSCPSTPKCRPFATFFSYSAPMMAPTSCVCPFVTKGKHKMKRTSMLRMCFKVGFGYFMKSLCFTIVSMVFTSSLMGS